MDIEKLYADFLAAGQQPCGKNDPQRGAKMRRYRAAKQQLFEALKADYSAGKLCSALADEIVRKLSASAQDPETFWGSAKAARTNQAAFAAEKEYRLFEELLRCYQAELRGEDGRRG